MASSQLFNTVLGIAKESSYGTAVTPAMYLPIDQQPRPQPQALRHTMDSGLRGKRAQEYDMLPGPGEGNVAFNGSVYLDSFPHLLMNLFGADAVTAVGSACQHLFTLNNAPPSHTIYWAQNLNAYNFAGARLSQLTLNFNAADGLLAYQAQATSKLAGTTTAVATPTLEALSAVAGWLGTVTVAGGAPASLMEGSLTFTIGLKPIHALNATQDIATLYALTMQIGGRLTFDFTQATEYNYYASSSGVKNAIVLGFSQSSTLAITLTMTKAAWRMVDITPADNIYTAVAQVNGTYNVTDTGPIAVSVANAQTTAY